MNSPCETNREKIANYVLGILSAEQSDALTEHISRCPECRKYAQALQDEKRSLVQLGEALDRDMKAREDKVIEALNRSAQGERAKPLPIWRTIMKNRITKLAAAAVIIIAAVLSISVLDNLVTPAYAIEQTIEAMRSINSIHAYCTDWDDSQGETWVQIDPGTGQEEYYYADQGNLLIVGTPQATYYYYKDKNLVRIRNEYVPASDVRISRFFEDMIIFVQQYHGELSFHFQFDEDLQQEVIMVHCSIPEQEDMQGQEYIICVDPQTKLPISLEAIKNAPGQGVKSIDRLEYNVTIPEGIFEFEIPDGAKVVYEKKDEGGK